MQKKISLILTLLILILLFTVSALCNLCTITPPIITKDTQESFEEITTDNYTDTKDTESNAKDQKEEPKKDITTQEEIVETTSAQSEKSQDNHNPIIIGFISPTQTILPPEQNYDFIVQAEDPDGDLLEYDWKVNTTLGFSPSFNPKEPKMNWYTPPKPGDYVITVTVTDGRGGQAIASMTITINRIAYNKSIPLVLSESGTVLNDGYINGSIVYAGDSAYNYFALGFVSFDITELKGGIISYALLSFYNREVIGDPSFFGPLYANALYWGKRQVNLSDISAQGTIIPSIWENGAYPSNCHATLLQYHLGQFLQNAVDSGQERFQVRIQFTGNITDSDGDSDGWNFDPKNISLVVSTSN